MKGKILKSVVVLTVLITMLMANIVMLCYQIVEAVYEELETQNITTNIRNIDFDAYFLNEGVKSHVGQTNLTEVKNLVLNVNVKEAGSLNDAKIKIENANFEILKDQVNNQYVKNINLDTNEIELNQIIYQNNIEIEIPIRFKKQDSFEEDYFEKENTISLTGTYIEGESAGRNVTGQIKTRVIYKEQTDINLQTDIEKYMNLGTEGILLQESIITEVVDNRLPRKTETIETNVPMLEGVLPESAIVIKNGTKLSDDKVTYNKEAGKVTISEDTSSTWTTARNEYKVIYNYKDIEFKAQEIEISTNMTTTLYTQEAIQKVDTKVVALNEKGSSVSISKTATGSMYKGYMYANAVNGTSYLESNKIEVSEINTVESIGIEKANEVFEDVNGNQFGVGESLLYNSTTLYKNELERIFGQDYVITITDMAGNVLHTVTKDTPDENGTITLSYNGAISGIKVNTSKPVSEGTFSVNNVRSMQGNTGYSKDNLKQFATLKTQTSVTANKEQNPSTEIGESATALQDTKTEAKIEINNSNLSTMQTNENIQLLLTLKSNSEEYDLYRNPVIEIVLPQELSIEVTKIAQLNGQEEINIANATHYTNDAGQEVVRLQLQGEQVSFVNEINEGIQITITANINIDKTTTTKPEQIKMYYTNENRPGETFEATTDIQLNSKYGVLMLNQLSGYNQNGETIESMDDKEKTANLESNTEAKIATQEITLVNNYDTAISGISVIGQVPTENQEETTFQMSLASPVQIEGKNVKVYYSETQTEDKNAETWVENVADISQVRSYKIEVQDDTMEKGETMKVSYQVQIPEQLENNETSYLKTDLDYQYLGSEETTAQLINLATPTENEIQEEVPGSSGEGETTPPEELEPLEVKVSATADNTAMEAGQTVYVGEAIQYKVTVTNNTEEDMKNLKIVATHDNAIFYGEVQEPYTTDSDNPDEPELDEDGNPIYRTFTKENPDLTNKEFAVETLAPGETQTFTYQIAVADVAEGTKLTGNIQVTAENQETKDITIPESEIISSEIKATLESEWPDDAQIVSRGALPVNLKIENKTQNTLQDIIVDIKLPEEVYFEYSETYFPVEENSNYELVDYGSDFLQIRIKELSANADENITTIFVNLIADALDTSMTQVNTEILYSATLNDRTYYSNKLYKTIKQSETVITANQTSNIEGEWIEDGDELIFTFNIENTGSLDAGLTLQDVVPDGLIIQEAYIMNNGTRIDLGATNVNGYYITLAAGTTATWTIVTRVDASLITTSSITNYATITGNHINITTNEITYKVKGKEGIEDNPGGSEDETYSISGVAWQDSNKNGVKDSSDGRLENIPVYLINVDTNAVVENGSTTTNSSGEYQFTDIKSGNYVVVFQYDTSSYRVTEYQKDGVSEITNSDVVDGTKTINGQEQKVAITQNLSLNKDLTNIDAGFVELETFDLKLDKYINRIIIQTNSRTTVREYNREQLAKIELDAKSIANSTVIIEYKILVTNEGEVAGYASEIVDYMPSDLTFSSEMNSNWFLSTDQNLYSRELANQIINPGETKEITLTLYKTMNNNNTGTTINTAELSIANNDNDIADTDSTPGNKATGEDDISTANVIISIRTGGVIGISVLIVIIMAVIATAVYIIKTKVLKDTEEEKNFKL